MYVIKINSRAEFVVCRAGEKVKAAVSSQDIAGLFDHRCHRSVAEHIVVTGSSGDLQKLRHRVLQFSCVDKMDLNAFFGVLFWREQLGRSVKTVLGQVRDHHQRRSHIPVESIGQSPQAHGAGPCHDGQLSVFTDSHLVGVHAHLCVVSSVKRADAAGHGLCQRGLVVGPPLVFQKAA